MANSIIADPEHPALRGVYTKGVVQRINYFRARSNPWEAIDVFLTLRCPLACRHCCTNSHPGRRETMSAGLLASLIDGLAAMGATRYVCLFGGEPAICPDLLRLGIERTIQRGMLPSSVTSGYWATDDDKAREGAALFRGVNSLLFSADRAHSQFTSIETFVRGIRAALALGINASVNYVGEQDEFCHGVDPPRELLQACQQLGVAIVMTPMSETGKASGKDKWIPPIDPDEGCGLLDTPVFDCDGNAYSCCPGWNLPKEGSAGHRLGRFPETSLSELRRLSYSGPMVEMIRNVGPMHVLRTLATGNPDRQELLRQSPPRTPCGACRVLADWVGTSVSWCHLGLPQSRE